MKGLVEMDKETKDIFDELKADPDYKGWTDEKLLQKTTEIIEESKQLVTFVDNRVNNDILIQFEALILLKGRPDLAGTLIYLTFFVQIKYLQFKTQLELAQELGYSEPTFKKKRDDLVKLGLLDIQHRGKNITFRINSVDSVRFTMPNINLEGQKKYLAELKKILVPINLQYERKEMELEAKKHSQLRLDGLVQERVQEIQKKKAEVAKKEEQRFPNGDYEIVLNAYKKYKGVGLVGPEIIRAKGAIKKMFLAQRSVKQIADCMKFFSENQNSENGRWMQSWTLETIMKKIPEFVAGKLESPKMGDDYRDL